MHPYLYVTVGIAHGILFTFNIILAVNVAPILNPNTEESLGDAGLFGVLGSFGVILSCVASLVLYDMQDAIEDKSVVAAVHAAIVAGLLYTWYYYGMLLIAGGN